MDGRSPKAPCGRRSSRHPLCPPPPFQVNFNEPLSMLQRLTEDLEYHELLDRAARCDSSLEQMCLVAAFSVSSYSTTVHRTAKPFNPLLGETYELDRLDEYGYRSISEQVRGVSASGSSKVTWHTPPGGVSVVLPLQAVLKICLY